MDVAANLLKLPPKAYLTLSTDPKWVIEVRRGHKGYWRVRRFKTADEAIQFVSDLNETMNISPIQLEAMETGSHFSWDIPGVNIDYLIASHGLECDQMTLQ